MNDLAQNAFAFIIGLGFLIFVHEAGHFFVARLFGVRVLVFSFGFGKRLFGFRKGHTDYRVSIFPLGGYVRMAGDSPEENVAANPDEFLSKPKWQRFLILLAGPLMNIVIAILFVSALAMVGREEYDFSPVIRDVTAISPAAKAGLQPGDRIVEINGEPVPSYDDVRLMFSINAGTLLEVTYVRNGVRRNTALTPAAHESEYGPIGRVGITYGLDPIVNRVEPGSAAAAAGIRSGDHILAANGKPVRTMEDFAGRSGDVIRQPLAVDVLRGATRIRVTLPAPKDAKDQTRGIVPPTRLFKLSLLPSLRYSVLENLKMLKLVRIAVARLIRGDGSMKDFSGPLSIAKISGDMLRRGPFEFLALLAMISLQLGVLNLLPIPVLDGGHIMILLIEGVARRDLSLRVKERIQQLGFAALATLMIVVLYHDVISNIMRMRNG